jgi:hypothetical protein
MPGLDPGIHPGLPAMLGDGWPGQAKSSPAMTIWKTGFHFSGSCRLLRMILSENRIPLFRIML